MDARQASGPSDSQPIDAMTGRATSLTESDLSALAAFLTQQGEHTSGPLRATQILGGRSNLTFKVWDDVSSWVVRRPPAAGVTPSAHDVGREYRVMAALKDTEIPVPRPVANCVDAGVLGGPFTVVRFVDGHVIRTRQDLDSLSADQILAAHSELIRVLVALHSVDYVAVGLVDFGRPGGFYERQAKRWREQWDRVAAAPLPDLDRLYERLEKSVPTETRTTIVHGDYRIDNTLLDAQHPDQIVALVDWEMSTLGDPITDVALLCAYQHPEFDHVVGEEAASTSSRWPSSSVIVEDYATRSGADLSQFASYLGLAYFKVAVIAEGIAARHRLGGGTGQGYSTAGRAVPGLIAAGLAALNGAP
jgi:aminoglycoside phosphotransferase (APT) family kinase protein